MKVILASSSSFGRRIVIEIRVDSGNGGEAMIKDDLGHKKKSFFACFRFDKRDYDLRIPRWIIFLA